MTNADRLRSMPLGTDAQLFIADGPGLSQSVRGVTVMRVRNGLIVEALGYVKGGAGSAVTAVRNV